MYEPGKPLFKRPGGSLIIFDGFDKDGLILAHIRSSDGENFQVMYLDSLLSRGYWEEIETESNE